MNHVYDFLLFLAQLLVLIGGLLIFINGIVAISSRYKTELKEGQIEVRKINEKYEAARNVLREASWDEHDWKKEKKSEKKRIKKEVKERKKQSSNPEEINSRKSRLYIIDFQGDIKASQVENLREEISTVLSELGKGDEVLLRLESPGGMVHGYGLAASQLIRIKKAGAHLTVSVDKVAASGGYMMACVASEIVAAPFALIGSVGVVAQIPNIHKLLKKNEIDYEILTAGEFKRTMTVLGENTYKGREKFMLELEDTHNLFKDFVSHQRPKLNISDIATGEVWYGERAIEYGLVDSIKTSDELIQERLESWDIFSVKFVVNHSWQEKIGMAGETAITRIFSRIWQWSSARFRL